ncbi:sensor histidine kinase KdpD [Humibacter sp. RRB41]|uniref:sensor histidine kinase n=1 Tax=Humibacter sp. RRB41 TaxID=2919946 RepID=UPI001FA9E2DB|nr:HAMP domain-containing sensor histidine kinase [Humibacter sp. RRB41]
MSLADDERRSRRAAVSVGLFVGIASAVIIAAGVGILLIVILTTGRHEQPRGGPPSGKRFVGDSFVVDVDHVLPWVIGLGVVGVALLALVGWFAARRSARPMAQALQLQRNFVADASHELRTPLTALSSRIQILQRRHRRGQPIDDTLRNLRRDADSMSELLNDLLLTAEGSRVVPDTPTVLTDAARDALEALAPVAADAGVQLELHADIDVAVDVPAVTVTRVAIALVDNAIQHAPKDSEVTLSIGVDGRMGVLRVADSGDGIVGIDPQRVFDRFARSAETGRRRGFGIGLALVREIAGRYGGDVAVESTSAEGTVFRLTLPVAPRTGARRAQRSTDPTR